VSSSSSMAKSEEPGTWTLTGGRLELDPFEPLSKAASKTLAEDSEAVMRYLA